MKRFTKIDRGFTLIELLVVIAIIGVLSIIVISSLNTARDKGRDIRRKSDLRQIQTALEMYYDKCGTYIVSLNCNGTPYGNTWNSGVTYGGWFNINYGTGSFSQGLVDTKSTGSLIIDPTGNTTGVNSYMITASKNNYTIWATIKNPTPLDSSTINRCYFNVYNNYSGVGAHNYCVSN